MQSFKLYKESEMTKEENRSNAFQNLKYAFVLFFGVGLLLFVLAVIF